MIAGLWIINVSNFYHFFQVFFLVSKNIPDFFKSDATLYFPRLVWQKSAACSHIFVATPQSKEHSLPQTTLKLLFCPVKFCFLFPHFCAPTTTQQTKENISGASKRVVLTGKRVIFAPTCLLANKKQKNATKSNKRNKKQQKQQKQQVKKQQKTPIEKSPADGCLRRRLRRALRSRNRLLRDRLLRRTPFAFTSTVQTSTVQTPNVFTSIVRTSTMQRNC